MNKLEFIITREEFHLKLQKIKDMTSLKSVTTMSQYVKLTSTINGLHLYANDGIAGIIQFIEKSSSLQVINTGSLLVTAKILINIIQHAPPNALITVKQLTKTLRVTFGNAKFNLDIIPSDSKNYFHFPDVKKPDEKSSSLLIMPAYHLERSFSSVAFATSSDKICRPFLCGVSFKIKNKTLTTTATDGFRLAKYQFEVIDKANSSSSDSSSLSSILIPKASILAMCKLLEAAPDTEQVAIQFDNSVFKLTMAGLHFYTNLVDSVFPDVDSLIPQAENRKNVFSINNLQSFLPIVERIASLSGRSAIREPLIIDLKDKILTLSTLNIGKGSAEEYANVDYVGKPVRLGVSSKFFLEILHSVNSNKVILLPGERNEPLWIKDQDNHNVQYLLMPVLI